jgi:hypothetical protein
LKAAPADRKTACRTTHLDAFLGLIDSVTGWRFGSPNNVLSSPLFGQSTPEVKLICRPVTGYCRLRRL